MLQVINLINVRLAQLDRAFGYGPKGREFESSNAHKSLEIQWFQGFFICQIFNCFVSQITAEKQEIEQGRNANE